MLLSLELSNSVERDAFIFSENKFIVPLSMMFSSCPCVGFILFAFCIYILYLVTFSLAICG